MNDVSFNKTGAEITNEDAVFICRALKTNHLRLLCLRECKIGKKDFHSILKCISTSHSLQQLTLNVGIVTSLNQVEMLAKCIRKNKSLTGLHIHGSELGDVGLQILGRALSIHPGIVSLDLGDCKLSDMSVDVLYSLMLPTNNRPGITELTLSDNPRITALGWAQFSMSLANCSSLRWLFLDYNPLGDYAASCILTGISASQSVEILDLEGCGLTEHTGQVVLHLVQNHLGSLSRVKLSNNRIRKMTIEAIRKHLSENHLDESDTASSITYEDLFDESSSSRQHRSSSSSSSSTSLSSSSSSSSSKSSSSSSSSDKASEGSDDDKKKKSKKRKEKKKKKDKEKLENVNRGLTGKSKTQSDDESATSKTKEGKKKKDKSKEDKKKKDKSKDEKKEPKKATKKEDKDNSSEEETKKKKEKDKNGKDKKADDKKSEKDKKKDKNNEGDKKKKKRTDNEDSANDDSFGEELQEVPVFYK